MNDKNLICGKLDSYGYFSGQGIELHLPVDTSYIKVKGLKKIIDVIDAFVGFLYDFNEKESIIILKDSAIFHNSDVDIPSAWDLESGIALKDFNEELSKTFTISEAFSSMADSTEFRRFVKHILKENRKYHIDPTWYGRLNNLRFLPKGDLELLLPLDLTCMKQDPIHQKLKEMIQDMGLFVAFSFDSHQKDVSLILLDDNVFGDIAYRNEKWDLKTNSFVSNKKIFKEIILNKQGDLRFSEKGIIIYVSYSTKDSNKYKIADISEELTKMIKIHDVLYWEEDMKDDIYRYMNDNIKKCDIMLLFCSQNALNSEAVTMEWQAALKIKKKIIPVFTNEKEIPALLSTKLGVFFDKDNINDTITKLYNLILKKSDRDK